MTTFPLSEVKARLSETAEEVATTHERVRITKNGREYVVLLAAEDLEAIEPTLGLLTDQESVSPWLRMSAGSEVAVVDVGHRKDVAKPREPLTAG
jgi:antitoxin YefM